MPIQLCWQFQTFIILRHLDANFVQKCQICVIYENLVCPHKFLPRRIPDFTNKGHTFTYPEKVSQKMPTSQKDKSIKLYLFSYFSSFSHLDSTCTPHVWHLRANNHVLLFNMLRIFYFYLSDRNIRLSLCLIRNHYRVKFSFGKDKGGALTEVREVERNTRVKKYMRLLHTTLP